jgi:hypothetical protein
MRTPEHIGRIRLNQREARFLARVLHVEHLRLLADRSEARLYGADYAFQQKELGHLQRIMDEVLLLGDQKGWDIGQSIVSYKEKPDTQVPARPTGSMG